MPGFKVGSARTRILLHSQDNCKEFLAEGNLNINSFIKDMGGQSRTYNTGKTTQLDAEQARLREMTQSLPLDLDSTDQVLFSSNVYEHPE